MRLDHDGVPHIQHVLLARVTPRRGSRSVYVGHLLAAALLGLAPACGLMQPTVTGTYVLESVNGRALPAPLFGHEFRTGDSLFTRRIEEVSDTIWLRADGMFASRLTIRRILCRPSCDEPGSLVDASSGRFWTGHGWDRVRVGIEVLPDSGRYRRRGSTILFINSKGERFEAELERGTLRTQSEEQPIRVYQRVENDAQD